MLLRTAQHPTPDQPTHKPLFQLVLRAMSALNALLLLALSAFVSRFRVFPYFSVFFGGPQTFSFRFLYLPGLRTIKPAKCFWPRQGDDEGDVDTEDPVENTLFLISSIFSARPDPWREELWTYVQDNFGNQKQLS